MIRIALLLALVSAPTLALELKPTVTLDDLWQYTRVPEPTVSMPDPVRYTPPAWQPPALEEQLHIYNLGDGEIQYRYEYGPADQPDVQYHDYSFGN